VEASVQKGSFMVKVDDADSDSSNDNGVSLWLCDNGDTIGGGGSCCLKVAHWTI
jgi:hypothetical protein